MSYADVNGIKLNYETHGTGRRLHLKLDGRTSWASRSAAALPS
jgi:hypothetical protein